MHIMNLKQSINRGLVVNLNMPEGDGGGRGVKLTPTVVFEKCIF